MGWDVCVDRMGNDEGRGERKWKVVYICKWRAGSRRNDIYWVFYIFRFFFFFIHFISASQCGVFTEGYECSKLNPYIWATRIAPASSPGAIFKNVGDFRRPFGHALRRTAVVHVLRRLAGP